MHLPALYPPAINGYYVSGDVAIAPDVILAPGVIVMADPNSRVTIAAGVCLGLGTVVHAYGGTITIREGAILGAGVLLVGVVEIGRNACLGPSTTIFNGTVSDRQLLKPGTLIAATEARVPGQSATNGSSNSSSNGSVYKSADRANEVRASTPSASSAVDSTTNHQIERSPQSTADHAQVDHVVYGKDYFLRMRLAMFPQGIPGSDSSSASTPNPWDD
ncbi:MAG: hypothetical protein AAGF24_03415 [Cyanobacteria bacterium P01_H01_bin.121]